MSKLYAKGLIYLFRKPNVINRTYLLPLITVRKGAQGTPMKPLSSEKQLLKPFFVVLQQRSANYSAANRLQRLKVKGFMPSGNLLRRCIIDA